MRLGAGQPGSAIRSAFRCASKVFRALGTRGDYCARATSLLLPLLLAACAAPVPSQYGPPGRQSTPAAPNAPTKSIRWSGVLSCTAHVDRKLPAITWQRIPFRQEGDRLTGLYTFTDHFKHQNSVVFSGTLNGQSARTSVTAVRANGSPNFSAEMTGSPSMMTGPMMSGMSRRPVRSCTLALSAP
jgi:hypothetical protein